MKTVHIDGSDTIDRLDRQIIHAVQVSPRASFSRIAEVIATSEQTVARRYRRLVDRGMLRVLGLMDPNHLGQDDWFVRIRCRPDGAAAIADALARRPDTSWVAINAGGTEVSCSVRSRTDRQRDDLLQRLPKATAVLDISAHVVLHRFLGKRADDWVGYGDLLTADQVALLRGDPEDVDGGDPTTAVAAEDRPLLDALSRDGQASYAALAAATGSTQGRVVRRIASLVASRALYFDVEIAPEPLGFTASAMLWLRVPPSALAAAGADLAAHDEVPFAAAISGPMNALAVATCRDSTALYRYVTTQLGAIPTVEQLEITPIVRRVKEAGSLVRNGRLAEVGPAVP